MLAFYSIQARDYNTTIRTEDNTSAFKILISLIQSLVSFILQKY